VRFWDIGLLAVAAVCCEPVSDDFPCSRKIYREFSPLFLGSHERIQLQLTVIKANLFSSSPPLNFITGNYQGIM
jgi:hypothetical protein